jgi:hypothetical protein
MFNEHLFPFASAPSASTNPSSATTIPDHEPVAYNDHMRCYRLELLATDNPAECGSLPLSGSGSSGGSTTPRVTLHSLDTTLVVSVTTDVPPSADVPLALAGNPASSVVPVGFPALTWPDSVPHPTTGLAPIPQPIEESSVPVSASTTSPVAPLATVVTRLRNNMTKSHVLTHGTILYNPA